MKVLQVNSVYRNGSTGKIVYDIHNYLRTNGIESLVCYGRGTIIDEKGVQKVCSEVYSLTNNALSRITGIMYGGCFFSTNRLIAIIKKERPDIVHLQCINGYFINIYRIVEWLKNNKVNTVLTLHAEFMYTGGCGHSLECNQWSTREGCGHSKKCPRWRTITRSLFFNRTRSMWRKMYKAFDGFNNIIVSSVSPWLMDRAMKSPVFENKEHVTVLNGVDTDVFHLYNTREFAKKNGLEEKNVVFYATPSFDLDTNHIKGGYYVIELAKIMPDICFVVAGSYSQEIIVPNNITLLGRVSDQKILAEWYSLAGATLLTSKKETFSMIVAESLCCGTPVVGFCAGAPEQIAIEDYSSFVTYGKIQELKKELLQMLHKKIDKNLVSSIAISKYSSHNMAKQYFDLYKQMIKS